MRAIVIGSGLLGVTSAWFLARAGCEVTVLERASGPAQGTSFANAGMLTPSMADPWNAPGILWHLLRWLGREDAPFLLRPRALPSMLGWGLSFLRHSSAAHQRASMDANLRLASYSLAVLRELRAALKLAYDESTLGTLKVFRDRAAFDAAADRTAQLAGMGLKVRAVTAAEAVVIEPALAPVADRLVGGVHCPADESGDARSFTLALAERARESGVRFVFNADVDGLESDGRRLVAARASGRRHEAEVFVAAAGSWSAPLLERIGVALPVRPVKGYSITVPTTGWDGAPRLPVVDDALHAAATPLGARLRVAGTAEIAGYDMELTPARIDNLFDLLLGLFPSYAPRLDRAAAQPWAGLRPVSPDGVPRIGQLGPENLFVNTGHGHLGWTHAAGSGALLADLVCGKAPAIAPAAYDPNR
ncbi:MAG: D-amino acid dehydrogenase [Gammaproteobacteria bacterium]